MADIESENLELNNILNIQKKYFKDTIITQILNLNYQGQSHHFLVDKVKLMVYKLDKLLWMNQELLVRLSK